MRLNPDCVRDILLTVEENTDFNTFWNFSMYDISDERLKNYSPNEFIYHIHQCYKAHLIDGCRFYDAGETGVVGDLTPYGHEFLSNIRKDSNWNKTKEIASSIGSNSLDVLKDIASNVISSLIQSALKI